MYSALIDQAYTKINGLQLQQRESGEILEEKVSIILNIYLNHQLEWYLFSFW